jgi:hypothetical protein
MKASVDVTNRIRRDYNFHWCNVIYLCWNTVVYDPYFSGSITVDYNRAPVITEYNPSNDIIDLQPGNCANFSVTAKDDDGTVPVYYWYLDGALVATGTNWQYCPGSSEGGSHLVKAVASDGKDSDEQIWTVNLPCLAIPGDVNASGTIALGDVINLVNYYFDKDGPGCLGSDPGNCWAPNPICRGDVNNSGTITLGDVINLVNYYFDKDGPGCLGSDPGNCWTPNPICRGDVNNSGTISLGDVINLVNYYFDKDGPGCLGADPGNCWTPISSGACCMAP